MATTRLTRRMLEAIQGAGDVSRLPDLAEAAQWAREELTRRDAKAERQRVPEGRRKYKRHLV